VKKIILTMAGVLSIAALSVGQAQPMNQQVTITAMTKVTLKINEPRSLSRQEKRMHQVRTITIGSKSFKLPAGVNNITVMHQMNLGQGKPINLMVAYNGSSCPLVISGRPLQYPARQVALSIGTKKMSNGMLMGYCKKAVISGVRA